MSGNTFGKIFCVTSYGESHGTAIGCVIDGCPPGLSISEEYIQKELDLRKPGTSKYVTQRKEKDLVKILSGVFNGYTTGTPISLLINNTDQRSQDYSKISDAFRPGHADYTYWQKYGIRDYRGGGRQSARETAVRVAAGAIAKKWLYERLNVEIIGYMSQLGDIEIKFKSFSDIKKNIFFSPNLEVVKDLEEFMMRLRKSGDSCGARISVVAKNVPVGLGEPVFDKLDAEIAHAMMGINAVKGVEIGSGFGSITQKGTEHSDEMSSNGFLSNNAGGILGGISTGQDIKVSLAIKPTSSIRLDRKSINKKKENIIINTHGRHDPCVGIRATPIVEAMLANVLIDHVLRFRAQCSDVQSVKPKISSKITTGKKKIKRTKRNFENPDPNEA